jgi:peptide-methionine (S)-S-oxide reductase
MGAAEGCKLFPATCAHNQEIARWGQMLCQKDPGHLQHGVIAWHLTARAAGITDDGGRIVEGGDGWLRHGRAGFWARPEHGVHRVCARWRVLVSAALHHLFAWASGQRQSLRLYTVLNTEGDVAMFFTKQKTLDMVAPADALPGRLEPLPTAETHFLTGLPLKSPVPAGFEVAMFGMGCFWGVERKFWQTERVWLTMVGYAAGYTPNPTYKETCTQLTGHNEVVRLVYDPAVISYAELLKILWEGHDPTQGMRQGNDMGSTYRSGIYTSSPAQEAVAKASKAAYQGALSAAGRGQITTEILPAPEFYYAEDYHQQYLAKNPAGYCGIGGTGVTCPIGTSVSAS